jgi:hypothetical protein
VAAEVTHMYDGVNTNIRVYRVILYLYITKASHIPYTARNAGVIPNHSSHIECLQWAICSEDREEVGFMRGNVEGARGCLPSARLK